MEKNFRNVIVVTQQPCETKIDVPHDKSHVTAIRKKAEKLERTLSKSSIDNNPIFMIYTKCENIESVNKVRKSLWRVPLTNRLKTLWWIYTWPIKFILTITIPNPKTYRRMYPVSFVMCIMWIGLNAYMIVWMLTVIGMAWMENDYLEFDYSFFIRWKMTLRSDINRFEFIAFFQVIHFIFPML